MAADPLVAVAAHAKTGDRLLLRLKSARERGKIAEYVCALRRWHKELQPLVEAYSTALAESLRQQDPRKKEYRRVSGVYSSLAQIRLLMTTATALYRLKLHLAAVRPRKTPGRKPGQGYKDDKAIKKMRRLVIKDKLSPWKASQHVVHSADQRNPDPIAIARRVYRKYQKLYQN